MGDTFWLWAGFNLGVAALLAFDLGVIHRRSRVITVREALWLSLAYVALAMVFAAGVFHFRGGQAGYEFVTGYLIEKSLSLDNVFVFVLVFSHFAVPAQYQYRVLFWGVLGALAMRAALIFAGTTLIAQFHWVVFVFGGFLLLTGIKMLLAADSKPDLAGNRIAAFVRRHFRITPEYHGDRFFVRREGVVWGTPLLLVLVLVEISDLIFAVDSIPAILAVSQDTFIVYTANVFAILGLRALYFAVAGIIHRFRYLKYGLSLVLVAIGAKMIANGIAGDKWIPVEAALAVTVLLIGGSIMLSIIATRRSGTAIRALPPPTGWVPGSPATRPQAPADGTKGTDAS